MENVDEMDTPPSQADLDPARLVSPVDFLAPENQSINWTPILIALAFLIVFALIVMNPMGIQFHKLMYGNSFGISEFSYRPPAAALMSA